MLVVGLGCGSGGVGCTFSTTGAGLTTCQRCAVLEWLRSCINGTERDLVNMVRECYQVLLFGCSVFSSVCWHKLFMNLPNIK